MNKKKQEFQREILIKKLKELYLKAKERRIEGMNFSEDSESDIHNFSVQAYSKEQFFSLWEREREMLALVEGALQKITANTYGVCEECQKPINEKRLKALPWARLCIRCQFEKEGHVAA